MGESPREKDGGAERKLAGVGRGETAGGVEARGQWQEWIEEEGQWEMPGE